MKTYTIPVTEIMNFEVKVEAKSAKEAREFVMAQWSELCETATRKDPKVSVSWPKPEKSNKEAGPKMVSIDSVEA